MAKVKICGITNLDDARAAVNAGCDALGFVFFKKSPRYIEPDRAKEIIRQIPKRIIKIGVFVNSAERLVKRIAASCKLDILQFHGAQSPEFCAKFKSYKIIKVFRVKNKIDRNQLRKYDAFAFLFDSFTRSKIGGSGKKFDWELIGCLAGSAKPVFLSGGLDEKNVRLAIKAAKPDWVDVSSGIELSPGKKDHKKMEKFIRAAKFC